MPIWKLRQHCISDVNIDVVAGMCGFDMNKIVRCVLNGDIVNALRNIEQHKASIGETRCCDILSVTS